MTAAAFVSVLVALISGAIKVSTPFMFVALGECLTEKSGRINLGLEGTLVLGAMIAYAVSVQTGSPWLGVLCAGIAGCVLGAMHGMLCQMPKVNDIAIGIAMMSFGTAVAFYFGKPYIQPQATLLPQLNLGDWTGNATLASMLQINPLFLVGIVTGAFMAWAFRTTRWGLRVRMTGDSAAAARAMGIPVNRVRLTSTAIGGFLAGIGGAFLSLSYPGAWNESLSSGQGLMAVALVIFARWRPVRCVLVAMLFGAAGALGTSLQSVGLSDGYYLLNAAPYVLTLLIMVGSSRSASGRSASSSARSRRPLSPAPGELSITK